MPKQLKAQPDWLRASISSRPRVVDRENNVIRGFPLAQEGDFKSAGRGAFDLAALEAIRDLASKAPGGLKSRFAHPTLSNDGLGKFLGRAKDPTIETIQVKRGDQTVPVKATLADLYLDQTALETPPGGGKPLGLYVINMAESDPDALSSSLVIKADKEQRLDAQKRPLVNPETGDVLPPIWRPKSLHAIDIVDTGDACDGLLSAGISIEGLPDALVRQGAQLLDGFLPDQPRKVVSARLRSWLNRYLSHRYGDDQLDSIITKTPALTAAKALLRQLEAIQAGGSVVLDAGDAPPLATPNGLSVGDSVQWLHELPAELRAEGMVGTILALATSGDLFIPGTSIKLAGTEKDSAVLVSAYDDDAAEDEAEGEPGCYYLVPSSRLTKMAPDDDEGETDDEAGE